MGGKKFCSSRWHLAFTADCSISNKSTLFFQHDSNVVLLRVLSVVQPVPPSSPFTLLMLSCCGITRALCYASDASVFIRVGFTFGKQQQPHQLRPRALERLQMTSVVLSVWCVATTTTSTEVLCERGYYCCYSITTSPQPG